MQPKKPCRVQISDLKNPIKKETPMSKAIAYFTTIVLLKPMEADDLELNKYAKCLNESIQYMYDQNEISSQFIRINSNVKGREFKFDSEFVLERGATNHLLHAHGLVKLKSKANATIGYVKYRTIFECDFATRCKRAGLSVPKIFIQHKEEKSYGKTFASKANIREYIQKNMFEYQVEDYKQKSKALKAKKAQLTTEIEEMEELKDENNTENDTEYADLSGRDEKQVPAPRDKRGHNKFPMPVQIEQELDNESSEEEIELQKPLPNPKRTSLISRSSNVKLPVWRFEKPVYEDVRDIKKRKR